MGACLLGDAATPHAVKIGSFTCVQSDAVRHLTFHKDIEPLVYTRCKAEYFKKILEFCYYYRRELPTFPKIYLRWAVGEAAENICGEWYNRLIYIERSNDPTVGIDHEAIFKIDSFDDLLYNLGIMHLVYKDLARQLEEGRQLHETPRCFGRAINPDTVKQHEESDERVRELLKNLAHFFEGMFEQQRSKFKNPCHFLTDIKGTPPLGMQAPSECFAPIFEGMRYEKTGTICASTTLERPDSAPCADSLFAKKEDGEYEEKACGMPIRSKSAPSESDSSGGDSINAFMGELLLRETHYRHVPTGRAKVSTDWSPPSGGVDSTGPLVFGTTSDKKDGK